MYNPYNLPERTDLFDLESVRLIVAGREDILSWSYGEVLKPETINYRTQKPEKEGLFCEKIFGPVKDINPHDTRFKGTRSRNIAVDKKGAIVTKAIVRRERMGHINLAAPIVHIWFLRVAPSPLSCLTGLTIRNLEKVVYFAAYLILDVQVDAKAELLARLTKIYKSWRQFLEKLDWQETQIKEALLEQVLQKKDKIDLDMLTLLTQIEPKFEKQADLIKELRQHQVLDFAQMQAVGRDLSALGAIFAESQELSQLQKAKVLPVYRNFLENKNDDITPNLKLELKKIKKLLDNLWQNMQFNIRKMDELYNWRRSQLKDDLNINELITETNYRHLPPAYRKVVTVGMGGEAVSQMLQQMDINELIKKLEGYVEQSKGQKQLTYMKRLKVIKGMRDADVDIVNFCITALPVIPPNLRPIIHLTGGRFANSDLNDLYRRVLNRNNRLKRLQELNAPEIICRHEKMMLQEAVDALIDNNQHRMARVTAGNQHKLKSLADILKRKQGRLRQNLLGKRVDYSGRSVIVAGPTLNILECGLPKIMALELFKPFVISNLINNDHVNNIRSASRLIESGDDIVWDALDEVIQDKFVLLNRAPTLHRLGIQAFKPKLIEGKAIQLHPLVCKGFNADFDGDQMAVHLPLSRSAQAEAATLMIAPNNLLHPADGTPILYLDQDIIMGLYYLTYMPSKEEIRYRFTSVGEAIFAQERAVIQLQTPVEIYFRGQRRETTLGRIFFNEIFPDDFPFQNESIGKDAVKSIMALVYERYDNESTVEIADNLKNLAFEYATKSGVSIGMSDFTEISGYKDLQEAGIKKVVDINQQYELGYITDSERYRLVVKNWLQIDQAIQELVNQQFNDHKTSLNLIVDSKARGGVNLGQIKRMIASIGAINDTSGRTLELPVKSNYFAGLPILEYFVAARGARKSLVDTALLTAESGHLTRRLVFVAQEVITVADDEEIIDPGFSVFREDCRQMDILLADRLTNRYAAEEVMVEGQRVVQAGGLITKEAAAQIQASDLDGIKIMSVLSSPHIYGIPTKSYGIDLANGQLVQKNQPIGIIAAQSIGEPSTQLKLDSKHSGGIATETESVVNTGLDRVEELFEARNPKGVGLLAPFDGQVSLLELNYDYDLSLKASADYIFDIDLQGATPIVKLGQTVANNESLALSESFEAVLAPSAGEVLEITPSYLRLKPSKILETRFLIPKNRELAVKHGQKVRRGDSLSDGSLHFNDLLRLRGVEATKRYILIEISRVFAEQGTHIADKHLEIIIRQMFSRLQIVDAGDSNFIAGDIISKRVLHQENQKLIQKEQRPISWCQLVMGITKVSSSSDSFLVAASFQDTTRTLVNAAINGRIDKLDGLIENVILGRKIPVGTGAIEENVVDVDFE